MTMTDYTILSELKERLADKEADIEALRLSNDSLKIAITEALNSLASYCNSKVVSKSPLIAIYENLDLILQNDSH